MPQSLLEQLSEIVANGRKQAERILESLENRLRVCLQRRAVGLPAKDSMDWHPWARTQTMLANMRCPVGENIIFLHLENLNSPPPLKGPQCV